MIKWLSFSGFLLFTLLMLTGTGQTNDSRLMPCKEEDISRYTAYKINHAPVIDGKLNEAIWKNSFQVKQVYRYYFRGRNLPGYTGGSVVG